MDSARDLVTIPFTSLAEWEAWLELNHATSAGIWLKLAKKNADVLSVSYSHAVEGALCFGWIDSQKRSFDEQFWLQRFTPRTPASKWSRINRDKADELIKQGRMQPPGAEQVEQAKRDGRWERAYEGQRRAAVPEDLRRELDENPTAKGFFETLDGANRYAILYRIQGAKRPETRSKRIAKFIKMLEAGEKIHP